MSTKDRQVTITPVNKQLRLIYRENNISDEAKTAFILAYNDLEQQYLQLKDKLARYAASRVAPKKQS